MSFFAVKTKCGHVGGKNYYTLKVFPIEAECGKEAAAIARKIARVKHHHKDAIRMVEKISREEYQEICDKNRRDPYFYCKNIQEHKIFVHDCDVYMEKNEKSDEREQIKKPIYKGKVLLRNPKRYFKLYKDERYAV